MTFGYLATVNVLRLFLTVLWVGLLCVTVFMLNSTTKYIIYHADKKLKIPTIVSTLTFISMINTIAESLKARKVFIFSIFSFVSSWNLILRAWHKFTTLGSGFWIQLGNGSGKNELVYMYTRYLIRKVSNLIPNYTATWVLSRDTDKIVLARSKLGP